MSEAPTPEASPDTPVASSATDPTPEPAGPRGAAAIFAPTVNAIFAPAKAFAALDARPVLAIWPIVWVTVAMMLFGFLNLDVTKQFMRVGMVQGMAQQGQDVDPEQMRGMIETMDTWAPVWATALNIFILLAVAIVALLVWVGAGIAGGNTRFARSFGVASVASVVHPFMATVFVTFMWRMNPPEIRRIEDIAAAMPTLGLSLLLGSTELSPFMQQVVLRVDLFNLWWIAVVAIGAQTLLGVKRGAAIGIGVGIWAATTGLAAFWATLGAS